MILTTHAIAGASAAVLVPQHPIVAFCAAFASHFVLDAIPHWDYDLHSDSVNPKVGAPFVFNRALVRDLLAVTLDGVAGIAFSLILFATSENVPLILACALAGMLPDGLQFIYGHCKHEPFVSVQRFHRWVHGPWSLKRHHYVGIATQILTVALIVASVRLF